MITYRVTKNEFRVISQNLGKNAERVLQQVAQSVESDWKSGVRVRTGKLRDSINTSKQSDGYAVKTGVDYSPHEEFGTRHMRGSHAAAQAATRGQSALDSATKGIIR